VVDPAQQQFQSLYSNHHGWLQGWLRGRLGNHADAADLAQDTFIRLLAKWRDDLGSEPRALLRHIANGLVIDLWRRQEVERAYLESIAHLPEPLAPSPEARLLIIESLLQIEALLRGLPPRTREIFLLAQLDGLTHAQIAQQQGVCLNTVRRAIHRALVACITAI
jgi:RNA polymerase sigma-70 factor (ECF subfamily)